MAKVSAMAKLVAEKGRGDELASAFDEMFKQVETEEGTELYVLNRSSSDPDTFWFYELYTDDAAASLHAGSDVMKSVGQAMRPLVASADLVFGTVVRAKGIGEY